MTRSLSRRSLLVAGGLAVSGSVGGCLLDNPDTAAGHVYIENTSPGDRRLALSVTAETDGTPRQVVDSWYDVPEGTALEMEGVLEPGQRYTVRAALEDAQPADTEVAEIDTCEEGAEGERVVSVRTAVDRLGVLTRGCDESYTQRELEYVEATQHRVGTVSGTVAGTASE